MPYDRDSRFDREGDYYRSNDDHYGRSYGSGRDDQRSSARDYQASGQYGRGDYGRSEHDRADYGARDYGNQRYGQREQSGQGPSSGYGQERYGQGREQSQGRGQGREPVRGHDYGRQPQGYDYQDRGFLDRAGDEVRSWFGDEDAERRRDQDQRHDERSGQTGRSRHDDDYHSWRSTQMQALDRDYDEYRRENRSRFEKEFSDWRSNRQTQRQHLGRVTEHQEVVGSDGQHVGTVDKVRGDRIILTKNDKDAGGHHHSVPCSWITSVDDKVMLNKSADEAKQVWRDEESRGAFGSDNDRKEQGKESTGSTNLNRSFSGTY